MPRRRPQNGSVIIIVSISASIALLLVVGAAVWQFTHGGDPEKLGKLQSVNRGTGLLAVGALVVSLLTVVVTGRSPKDEGGAAAGAKKPGIGKRVLTQVLPIILPAVSSFVLASVSGNAEQMVRQRVTLEKEKQALESETLRLKDQVRDLDRTVTGLNQKKLGILHFLGTILMKERISLLGEDVNWSAVVSSVDDLPPGTRQTAALGAILLAWKDVPFKLGGKRMNEGLDSPTFIIRALAAAGLEIPQPSGLAHSEALMKACEKVNAPQTGDLMVYRGVSKGDVGNYVLMYLAPEPGGNGVGLGSLESKNPLQIINSRSLRPDKFEGYFRPHYERVVAQAASGVRVTKDR